MNILKTMDSFATIEFGVDDICRSGLVKDYLVAKHKLGIFYR
jgi:hypothetical protein